MAAGKVVSREVAGYETGNRERIAERERHRCRIRRCEIERARFVLDIAVDGYIGIASEDSGFPVMAISLAPSRLIVGMIVMSSVDSPE